MRLAGSSLRLTCIPLLSILMIGTSGIAVTSAAQQDPRPVEERSGADSLVAIAAGEDFDLGIGADGRIVAWGNNEYGQCDVPAPNADFVAVAAGFGHSLGLKADGRIVAWGANGRGQCDVPKPNADFKGIAAGGNHSLGLRTDGTIVAWGGNNFGQCGVPAPNADFVGVAAGEFHSLGLTSDGRIVAWGYNSSGQCDVPEPNTDFVALAAGEGNSMGLMSSGKIVAWGNDFSGKCDVPAPNAGFVTVAAGETHSLGLKSDGTIVAWGDNNHGQCSVPGAVADFVAVAAGKNHSLGLRANGDTVVWGDRYRTQKEPPEEPQAATPGSASKTRGITAAELTVFRDYAKRIKVFESECKVATPGHDETILVMPYRSDSRLIELRRGIVLSVGEALSKTGYPSPEIVLVIDYSGYVEFHSGAFQQLDEPLFTIKMYWAKSLVNSPADSDVVLYGLHRSFVPKSNVVTLTAKTGESSLYFSTKSGLINPQPIAALVMENLSRLKLN
jgi:alpha-tubulin suppressor-like RCC1 family protein